MKKSEIGNNKIVLEFSDILDFVEYCNQVPRKNFSRTYNEHSFVGGSFTEAVNQAKRGNPDLVKKLFDGTNCISYLIEKEVIGEMRDVTGEYFDVADFLSGEPEVFRRNEYADKKPVVPVYANVAVSGYVKQEKIINRGCAIVALCDELNRSGFIVDLNLVDATEYNGKTYYTIVKVDINPLDLDTAAFIVANPLFPRRLWFAMLENVTGKSECDSYGTPTEYDLSDLFGEGASGFYFVSSTHKVYNSKNFDALESAKDHVLEMLDEFKNSASQVILG